MQPKQHVKLREKITERLGHTWSHSNIPFCSLNFVYPQVLPNMHQPKDVEEVKEVSKTEEDRMKEYQLAANRLDSARLVAKQLQVHIEPENLQLPTPLSSLGEYEMPIHLPKSIPKPQGKVQWTLSVKIRKW